MPQLSLDFARMPIPGHPKYTIDRNGTVYSQRGKPLKTDTTDSYHKVKLTGGKWGYVHQLVLLTFVGPRPEGLQACHKNSDRADNRLSNLVWGTRQRNARDRKKLGYYRPGLTAEQKQQARYLYEVEGWSYEKLHRRFNCDQRTIRRYKGQENWQRRVAQGEEAA